jgi:hypothetical protein
MTNGADIVNAALGFQGVQYKWGGADPSGFDCSGLVQYIFGKAGIALPRTTYNQINVGAAVGIQQLRPGDLVFFETDASQKGPDHVGIYIGSGKFIAAPRPGQGVQISSLTDSYYQQRFVGGRRVPGVQSGGVLDLQTATTSQFAQSTPPPDKETLASSYGMSYAFFQSADPELKSLFQQAVKGTWTPDVFTAHLKNTNWWKNNSGAARAAAVMKTEDPATYNANIAAASAAVGMAAGQMGAILTPAQQQKLATNIVTLGWGNDQVQNFLGQYVDFNAKHVIGGQAGAVAQQLRSYAYNMGVSVSDQQLKTYAQYIARGVSDMTGVMDSIRQTAAGAFPAFSRQIAAGATVSQLADPYVQMMANELQVDPAGLTVNTPLIKNALNRMGPDGKPNPMSLTDFQQAVRSQPGWSSTPAAVNSTMSVAKQVLSNMGVGG